MNVNRIIIHHSLTKDGNVVNWQAIRKYHTSYRRNGNIITEEEATALKLAGITVEEPWKDIGYHFGIEKINNTYEILIGRTWDTKGAHTKEHNEDIGICCVGNYDIEIPSKEMLIKLMKLSISLMRTFGLTTKDIVGHRTFANKTCPGKNFDLDSFRKFCLTPWDLSLIGG